MCYLHMSYHPVCMIQVCLQKRFKFQHKWEFSRFSSTYTYEHLRIITFFFIFYYIFLFELMGWKDSGHFEYELEFEWRKTHKQVNGETTGHRGKNMAWICIRKKYLSIFPFFHLFHFYFLIYSRIIFCQDIKLKFIPASSSPFFHHVSVVYATYAHTHIVAVSCH